MQTGLAWDSQAIWEIAAKEGKRLVTAAEHLGQEPLALRLGKSNQTLRNIAGGQC